VNPPWAEREPESGSYSGQAATGRPAEPPAAPDLDKLRERSPDGKFASREWDRLAAMLRPLGLAILYRKGVPNEDAEDVFFEAFAQLTRGRASDGKAPVELVSEVSELVPLFSTMLGHRAIDWARARKSLKNRPNVALSFDAAGDDTDRHSPLQIADPRSPGPGLTGSLSFREIYFQCRECLEPFQWKMIYEIFIGGGSTRGDLVDDPGLVEMIGADMAQSVATRRRRLNDHIDKALAALGRGLGGC
jgi:hypothetical protein